jgi:DNA polymerase-3 subunit gamma/tau
VRAAPPPPQAPAVAPEPPRNVSASAPSAAPADDGWHALVERLPLTGMVRQLAQHCELARQDDAQIALRLAPTHKFLMAHQDKLLAELAKHYGRALKLEILLADTEGETPKERADNVKRERQERAIAAIESDPFVREACDLFDASIDESTIKPI